MNGRFTILLRRRQNVQEGVNVTVQCNNLTRWSEYVPGTVDNTAVFSGITPVAGWYDFTNYIENAEKLSLSWDKTNSSNGKDGSNYDKGISSDLMFFDAAFYFIKDWLLTSECQILNAVEVKIVDLIAKGTYRLFEIKNDNIDYAPIDDPCQFNIKLREQDTAWHGIHKTFIWDDWQGWFKSGGKEHPCFLTCIEPRPRLVQSARMALLLFFFSNPNISLLYFITGKKIKESAREVLNANRFVDAPLVRTYIENVAGKCGLFMDTIFDLGQPFQYACIFYPQAGYMHESNEEAVASPSLAYHFDNRWLITIAELFDKLKVVFAAEWYVTPNNTIVFKHTKDLIDLLPIYDFTITGATAIYDGTIPADAMNSFVNNYHKVKSVPRPNYERIKDAAEISVGMDGRLLEELKENNNLQRQTLRAMKNMSVSANIDRDGVSIMVNEYVTQMEKDKRL